MYVDNEISETISEISVSAMSVVSTIDLGFTTGLVHNVGNKIYVTNQGAGTVSVIDVTTHSILQNINVGSKPNGIALKQ